jgi:hypothetical protein
LYLYVSSGSKLKIEKIIKDAVLFYILWNYLNRRIGMAFYKDGRATERGIIATVEKAKKRAAWYAENYRGANDFQKRYVKQFHTVIGKYKKTHEFTPDLEKFLTHLIPGEFLLPPKIKIERRDNAS